MFEKASVKLQMNCTLYKIAIDTYNLRKTKINVQLYL